MPEHNESEQWKNKGVKRLWLAFGYSVQGIKAAWKNEAAFRQELWLLLVLLPLAIWLGDTGVERAMLLFSVLLIPVMELINSSIEAAVDRAGLEHHPLSGRAKDMGSAVVLLTMLVAVIVWACILLG